MELRWLNQINTLGRTAQGVRLINLKEEHYVTTASLVEVEPESDSESDADDALNSENSQE